MICARCSREIEHDSSYCRFCGAAVAAPAFSSAAPRRLFRSVADRKIAGVCGGLAEYFALDPTLVRLAVIILAIYPGAIFFGLLAYAIAWMVIPTAPAAPPPLHTAPTPA
jgi:phage shock protein C